MIKRAISAACTGALLALALVGGMTERAEAGPATVTLAGTIDGSVNGTSLADNTPFTVIASFRPSANLAGGGYGAYADPGLTFIIDSNTYVVAPNSSLTLVTIAPPIDVGLGIYGVSIPSQTGPLNVFFDAATTTVTAGGNIQTVYSTWPPISSPPHSPSPWWVAARLSSPISTASIPPRPRSCPNPPPLPCSVSGWRPPCRCAAAAAGADAAWADAAWADAA